MGFSPSDVLRASALRRTAQIMVAHGATYAEVAERLLGARSHASAVRAWLRRDDDE